MSITRLFNIELPLIQAPMAGVQDYQLAVAVSNAGGLGSLPCAMLNLDALDKQLTALRAGTDKPINVNFFCHTQSEVDPAVEQRWRQRLTPYFNELGIDSSNIAEGPKRNPYSTDIAAVVEQYRPEVVSFHFGLPEKKLLQQVKSWGSKVISSATTVDEAKWLAVNGVDAIIAQGSEAGGHRGHFLSADLDRQLGTFALLPQVVNAVDVPVIAAGGIADAKGVLAATKLGADGCQIGTAYLLCPEAKTSNVHREALKSQHTRYTALTNLFSGRPARSIVNRIMRELGAINSNVPAFPHASAAIGALRNAAEQKGDGGFSPLWCGQNATGCQEVPAEKLTRQLVSLL